MDNNQQSNQFIDPPKSIFSEKAWLHYQENEDKTLPPVLIIPHKLRHLWILTLVILSATLLCITINIPVSYEFNSLSVKLTRESDSTLQLHIYEYPFEFAKYIRENEKIRLTNSASGKNMMLLVNNVNTIKTPNSLNKPKATSTFSNNQNQTIFIRGSLIQASSINVTASIDKDFYNIKIFSSNENILSSMLFKELQ